MVGPTISSAIVIVRRTFESVKRYVTVRIIILCHASIAKFAQLFITVLLSSLVHDLQIQKTSS